MESKTTLIYPYSAKFAPFLRYLLRSNTNYIPVALKGLRLNGKDAGEADQGQPMGLTITDNLEAALEQADTVLFVDYVYQRNTAFREKVLQKAYEMIDRKKKVCIAMSLSDNEQNQLAEYAAKSTAQITFYNQEPKIMQMFSETPALFGQQATVIGVGQIFPELDSTQLVLSLHQYLQEKGYRVNTFLDAVCSELIGLHHLPKVKLDALSVWMVAVDHYIEQTELHNRSDIILVQFPGGLQQYDRELTGDFGAVSSLLSQVVKCDYFFCCLPFSGNKPEMLEALSEVFAVKYNTRIDIGMLSNMSVDLTVSRESKELVYLPVREELVTKEVQLYREKNPQIPMYSLQDTTGYSEAFEEMLAMLQGYR